MTASDGRVITYSHEPLAGLTSGNLEQVIGLEGITQTYAYQDPNDAHNVSSFQRHAGATPVLNTYDNQDRDGLTDYQYDGLDRLTAAVYPLSSALADESYDYDRVGNREVPLDPNAYDYDGNNQGVVAGT